MTVLLIRVLAIFLRDAALTSMSREGTSGLRGRRPASPASKRGSHQLSRWIAGAFVAGLVSGGIASTPSAWAQEDGAPLPPYRQLCSHCHLAPDPSILPKEAWPATIYQMGALGGFGVNVPKDIDLEAVVDWYSSRAPSSLPLLPATPSEDAPAAFAATRSLGLPNTAAVPFVSNLLVTQLTGTEPELLISDMKNGGLWLGSLDKAWSPQRIADLASPGRAEATDLDGDGRMDLVVAVLGSPMAMDHLLGQVVWLRQTGDQQFEPIVLAEALGRVADVQPVDIDADGDTDLAVAEFGWRQTGRVFLLLNESSTHASPTFTRVEIDGNHGASRLAATDVDQDGRLDLVALFAQEHELVRVYRNKPTGWSETHDIYRAPHHAWGHSSLQVVDLDSDGDSDVLLTNGDSYDNSLLKPDHGVRWLENRGGLTFVPHEIAALAGRYAAAAADLDGDGDLDVVVSAMAEPHGGARATASLASLVWAEQTQPGVFRPHVLETGDLRHPLVVLHDVDRNGQPDILVGNGCFNDSAFEPSSPCVQIWTARGR